MGADQHDNRWDENLSNIQLGLNGTVNRALEVPPSVALMGFRVINNGMLAPEDRRVVDITEIRQRIVASTIKYQADQKHRFDEKRSSPYSFEVGDLVLTRIASHPATGRSQKLLPKWRGPFLVTRVLSHDRYAVSDIPGSGRSRLKYNGVAGLENMRRWVHSDD